MKFKILVIGEPRVGKTALISKFVQNYFMYVYQETIGIEYNSAMIYTFKHNIELQIWDTGGNPEYRSIIRSYYDIGSIILLVYDTSTRYSFLNLNMWLKEIDHIRKKSNPLIFLIGTKADLQRQVTTREASRYAQKNKLHFREISSITQSHEVRDLFSEITSIKISQMSPAELEEEENELKIMDKKESCCWIL